MTRILNRRAECHHALGAHIIADGPIPDGATGTLREAARLMARDTANLIAAAYIAVDDSASDGERRAAAGVIPELTQTVAMGINLLCYVAGVDEPFDNGMEVRELVPCGNILCRRPDCAAPCPIMEAAHDAD